LSHSLFPGLQIFHHFPSIPSAQIFHSIKLLPNTRLTVLAVFSSISFTFHLARFFQSYFLLRLLLYHLETSRSGNFPLRTRMLCFSVLTLSTVLSRLVMWTQGNIRSPYLVPQLCEAFSYFYVLIRPVWYIQSCFH